MELAARRPVVPLYMDPREEAERVDEVLWGWPVTVLEEGPGDWLRVETAYRYRGWARLAHFGPAWQAPADGVVAAPFADLLSAPTVEAPVLDTLPRGALVRTLPDPGPEGWRKIALPEGREGYTKSSYLEKYYEIPPILSGAALRRRAVDRALRYLGTPYRWGGKSPLGIDCSGLTFMAWFFQGVRLYRDARLAEGFPARAIAWEERQPGDLLYFPGHIALYLGAERYIHATARAGDDGVVINSLDPAAPDFRGDLLEKLQGVGSVFPLIAPEEAGG